MRKFQLLPYQSRGPGVDGECGGTVGAAGMLMRGQGLAAALCYARMHFSGSHCVAPDPLTHAPGTLHSMSPNRLSTCLAAADPFMRWSHSLYDSSGSSSSPDPAAPAAPAAAAPGCAAPVRPRYCRTMARVRAASRRAVSCGPAAVSTVKPSRRVVWMAVRMVRVSWGSGGREGGLRLGWG